MTGMRKALVVLLVAVVALLAVAPLYAEAGGRGVRSRVFIGVGPAWWGPYPYYSYPYYYGYPWPYYPPYYAYPPLVRQEPPVYIEQPTIEASTPEAPPQAYWYYCSPAGGYYPAVKECPDPWVKVPPRQ
jgi:hypothetical protein